MQLRDLIKETNYLKKKKNYEQGRAWSYIPETWRYLIISAASNILKDEEYKDAFFLSKVVRFFQDNNVTEIRYGKHKELEDGIAAIAKKYKRREADTPETLRDTVCLILRATCTTHKMASEAFLEEHHEVL